MDGSNITLGIAFIAGLASFLSPCVFSLVPAYVGYLSGRSTASSGRPAAGGRLHTLSHGLAFVLGFSTVFILLGVAASAVGGLFYDLSIWIARIGGVIVIIFGLYMTGVLKAVIRWLQARFSGGVTGKLADGLAQATSYLDYDMRPQTAPDRRMGYLSSALMGVFFSAGWSPCVGPTLGLIMTLAAQSGEIAQGVFLFVAYSAGLAVPFLLAATQVSLVTNIIRRYGKLMHYVEVAMGVLLIFVGYLLLNGTFERLASLGTTFSFLEGMGEITLGTYLLFGFLALTLLGMIPAVIASNKGRSFLDWWFFGAGLFIIALPMAIMLKPHNESEEDEDPPAQAGISQPGVS